MDRRRRRLGEQGSIQNHEFDDTRLPEHTMEQPSPPFSFLQDDQEMEEERPFVDFVRSANPGFNNSNSSWTPSRAPNASRPGQQYPPRTMQQQGAFHQNNFPAQDFDEYHDWGHEDSVQFQPHHPPQRQYHQRPIQQEPPHYYMQQQQQQQHFQPQHHYRSYPPQSAQRAQYMENGRGMRQPPTSGYPPQAHPFSGQGRRQPMMPPHSQQSHSYHGGYSNVGQGSNGGLLVSVKIDFSNSRWDIQLHIQGIRHRTTTTTIIPGICNDVEQSY